MARSGIVIIGNYGATNVGDEAVLSGVLTLAKQHGGKPVTVLSYDPSRTTAEHGCEASPLLPFGVRSFLRFDWLRSFRILARSEEVWIGGGALFTDEKLFAILLWGWHVLWSRLLCGRVVLVANTVGPIRTPTGSRLMRLILPMVHAASVRDAESEKVLRCLGFKRGVTVGADPAFLIEPVAENADFPKTIIISLRPWIRDTPGLLPDLAAWIDARADAGYRVTLLPFQTMHDDDRVVLADLYSRVTKKDSIELVEKAEDLPSIMRRIASADLVVGMRLHSLILSTVQETPFVGLSYSDKVTNFCWSVGMEESCFDLGNWNRDAFSRETEQILTNTEEVRLLLAMMREKMCQAALTLSPKA